MLEEAPQNFNFNIPDMGMGELALDPDPMGGPMGSAGGAMGGGPMGAPDPTFTPSFGSGSPDPMGGIGSPMGGMAGGAGTPPSMGLTSVPTGAAGIKTPTMKMPSGGGYSIPDPGGTSSLSPKTIAMLAARKEEAAKKAATKAEAAKWDFELPSWHLSGVSPTSEGEWKESSYTHRPKISSWAKKMGMTPEMWTKGGEGLIPYDPRYVDAHASSGGLGIGGSHLPMKRTDPAYHAMGTPDPFYYVRPGGKERLAETGKWRDFPRGGEWRPGYVHGRGPKKESYFINDVTEFTPSWLKPGMTSWPGMPE